MGAGAILQGLVKAGTKARLGHVQGRRDAEAARQAQLAQEAEAEEQLQQRLRQEALLKFQLEERARQDTSRKNRVSALLGSGMPQDRAEVAADTPDVVSRVLFPDAQRKSDPYGGRTRDQWLADETAVARARGDGRPTPQPSPMQNMARVDALRGQFNTDPAYKSAAVIAEQFGNIRDAAADPSAAGDLKLIFSFMKMQDPGSTVREGEFANAQNAAGVPDMVRNLYNRALEGTRLNPQQRQDFLRQAEATMKSQRRVLQAAMRRYEQIARRREIDPADVVYDPFEIYDVEPDGAASSDRPASTKFTRPLP